MSEEKIKKSAEEKVNKEISDEDIEKASGGFREIASESDQRDLGNMFRECGAANSAIDDRILDLTFGNTIGSAGGNK